MIDAIREFIGKCPLFSGKYINVNYLGCIGGEVKATYSVEAVPTSPVVKQYTDGGQLCQVLFVVASRELYTESPNDNTAVMKFYDDFAAWIEEKDKAREYPALPAPCVAQSVEVMTGPYLFEAGTVDARYQIQCRLTYYKDF